MSARKMRRSNEEQQRGLYWAGAHANKLVISRVWSRSTKQRQLREQRLVCSDASVPTSTTMLGLGSPAGVDPATCPVVWPRSRAASRRADRRCSDQRRFRSARRSPSEVSSTTMITAQSARCRRCSAVGRPQVLLPCRSSRLPVPPKYRSLSKQSAPIGRSPQSAPALPDFLNDAADVNCCKLDRPTATHSTQWFHSSVSGT